MPQASIKPEGKEFKQTNSKLQGSLGGDIQGGQAWQKYSPKFTMAKFRVYHFLPD